MPEPMQDLMVSLPETMTSFFDGMREGLVSDEGCFSARVPDDPLALASLLNITLAVGWDFALLAMYEKSDIDPEQVDYEASRLRALEFLEEQIRKRMKEQGID